MMKADTEFSSVNLASVLNCLHFPRRYSNFLALTETKNPPVLFVMMSFATGRPHCDTDWPLVFLQLYAKPDIIWIRPITVSVGHVTMGSTNRMHPQPVTWCVQNVRMVLTPGRWLPTLATNAKVCIEKAWRAQNLCLSGRLMLHIGLCLRTD